MSVLLRITKMCISLSCLTIGGLIYLGFRTETLLMFTWSKWIGMTSFVQSWRTICSNTTLPEWVIFSLPDGLWSFAYILFMDAIWMDYKNPRFIMYASILPTIAIILEFFQLFGLLSGTFDLIDLLCYLSSILFFIIIK